MVQKQVRPRKDVQLQLFGVDELLYQFFEKSLCLIRMNLFPFLDADRGHLLKHRSKTLFFNSSYDFWSFIFETKLFKGLQEGGLLPLTGRRKVKIVLVLRSWCS